MARPVLPRLAGFDRLVVFHVQRLDDQQLLPAERLVLLRGHDVAGDSCEKHLDPLRTSARADYEVTALAAGNELAYPIFATSACGPGDDVDADDFADFAAGFGAGVDGRANGGHVAVERDGDQAAADLVLLDEVHVGRLQRRVHGLDGRHDALGLDQSDCFWFAMTDLQKKFRQFVRSKPSSVCSCDDQFFVGRHDPDFAAGLRPC